MASVYFYYSAMNAGKSTTLLQSAHNYRERGMRCLLFAPKIDGRYGEGKITSRIGLQSPAVVVSSERDLFVATREEADREPLHCVLVDEAQFLSKLQVLQLCHVADELDIPVLCYGLRTDFRGEPFEGSQYLLAWADRLVEIKTICRSGRKATFNARLSDEGARVIEGDQIDIGHHYEAMSRAEFGLADVFGYAPPAREGEVEDQSSGK